ncbi:2-amino-4-hydroxy-6-hydroxymethyldihydropteridine diphosphokinase [uncultured Maribacter sp.]|uniref:2-amino-4-hydroxy-6- hydroxymethyldihydropteridine diphosphokinase n=1 Tax=uncultured Maribacter sp. TaxID=431308 RepID=UPI0026376EE8|nr:2-amino-4-hydroxy-6-hydroxymethyldihydropteridine diphosphokinase [uncultured Maribacter sp.]
MNKTTNAYISIGSNLGKRLHTIQQAIFLIQKNIGKVTNCSQVYECPAWGFIGENFLNACILVQTTLSPNHLLEELLKIEKELGRERSQQNGYQSRTIDLDIVYYGISEIKNRELTIPHPKLQDRLFVLRPLADIAPQFYHPILQKDTRNLIQECRDKSSLTKTSYTLFCNRKDLFSRTQFISIEGNIGAGKTSLATKISEDFNAKLVLERFAENPFLPNFYKDQSRYAFPLEMSFLADRYQQFSDDTSQFDLFKSFMVSDYDIFKSLIFAKVTLQKDEYELYKKIFNFMYKEVKKPQIYVYLYQTTERLLENIKKRGRDYEQNIQTDYLEKINRGYFDFLKGYPKENSLVVDVSELDFVSNKKDYDVIIEKIQNLAIEQLN